MSIWFDPDTFKTSWDASDVTKESNVWTRRSCRHHKFGPVSVTCKELPHQDQDATLRSIEAEVTTLRNARHSSILQVHGCAKWNRNIGLVIEHVDDGGTLRTLLKHCQVPWNVRLMLLRDLASALAYLHHRNEARPIVHGHLDASKVRLSVDLRLKLEYLGALDEILSVVPNDFFRAKTSKDAGQQQNVAYDVYCFGLVALEMITRQIPDSDTVNDIFEAISNVKKEIKAKSDAKHDLHLVKLLEKVVKRCLAANITLRPDIAKVRDLLRNELRKRDMRSVVLQSAELLSSTAFESSIPLRTQQLAAKIVPLSNFSYPFLVADHLSLIPLQPATSAPPEIEHEMIVFMGGLFTTSEVFEYNPVIDTMYKLPSLQVGRWSGFAATYNSCLYMIGGLANGQALAVVECLVIGSKEEKWQFKRSMLEARNGAVAVTVGDEIYITGGFGSSEGIYSSIECYNPTKDVWTKVGNLLTPRGNHAATGLENTVYSMGGTTNGDVRCHSMECFDVTSHQSTLMPSMTTRRSMCAAAYLNGSIYVCGGQRQEFEDLDTAERFDISSGSWETDVPKLTMVTKACGACVVQDKIYTVGGYSDPSAQLAANGVCFQSVGLNNIGKSIQVFDSIKTRWDVLPRKLERDWIQPAVVTIRRKRRLFGD